MNFLNEVIFTEEAVVRYNKFADGLATAIAQTGISPDDIPDEQISELPAGELAIYVDLPNARIGMTIPASEWAWKNRN